MDIRGGQVQVAQLDLAVRPGQVEGAQNAVGVAILVGQRQRLGRLLVTAVQKMTAPEAPDSNRTRRRRLKTGSSTAPVVPSSTAPGSRAAGLASVRPRPRKRARSVSNCG
jgi:hypothetical protein